jgi:galactose mutarotase-like enzyme
VGHLGEKLHLISGVYTATIELTARPTVTSLTRDGIELLAPEGCPFISPWFGRLPTTTYDWSGKSVDLVGLESVHISSGMPLHGVTGLEWVVSSLTSATATLHTSDLTTPGFPFPHRFVLHARLSPSGLHLTASLENHGPTEIPAAFAWHPYFPGDTVQAFGAFGEEWVLENGIPTGEVRHHDRAVVPRTPVDALWAVSQNAEFTVTAPGRDLHLVLIKGFNFVVSWVPDDSSRFCLEPLVATPSPFIAPSVLIAPSAHYDTEFVIS